ncbi:ATP-binding protein [Castellaniella caeni]|uniref:ATP-binding protein n=1 Tax=Castellaniella caeni TaxID=266123 RepID=UPI000C9F8633|nr:ATP-binding protein [Castellaniella caeni]
MTLARLLRTRYRSLRLRLLVGVLAWVLVSVAVAGWGIQQLFREHIQAQLQSELNIHLDQLTAQFQVSEAGEVSLASAPSDPRFSHPFSGLYWQIVVPPQDGHPSRQLRSRSLWDARLPDRYPGLRPGHDLRTRALGPQGRELQVRVREVDPADGPYDDLILIAAADQALWAEPVSRFNRMLALALGVLVLGMALAAWMQVSYGLRPLVRLRKRLAALRAGRAERIEGAFPSEVQPLVEDFNQVLERNAQGLERARQQAGNLAHALKTPLAVLSNAAATADPALPRLVLEQVEAARRQVDYHLAHARAAAAVRMTGLRSPILPLLQGLVRVMRRVHAERALDYDLMAVPEGLAFRGEAQDFQEMLGNVLDNAGKWARHQVRISARRQDGELILWVEDDGPGLSPERAEAVFERGKRADERTPGSGLGLNIVRDLADLYGGWARIETGELGGARVVITLPAADV